MVRIRFVLLDTSLSITVQYQKNWIWTREKMLWKKRFWALNFSSFTDGTETDRETCMSCVLGDLEVTANLYCNFAYLYSEGCVICSTYLR